MGFGGTNPRDHVLAKRTRDRSTVERAGFQFFPPPTPSLAVLHFLKENGSAVRDPIADARLGQHDPGVVGMIFDLLAQLADIDAKILRVFGMSRAPDRGEDLLVGHDAPGMAGEER